MFSFHFVLMLRVACGDFALEVAELQADENQKIQLRIPI